MIRRRLSDRRCSVTFNLEAGGLPFTATASRFDDGSLGELFWRATRSTALPASWHLTQRSRHQLALQFGCPVETSRKALKRDGQGRAIGPLGVALDMLAAKGN